ncbi:MAG: hypothetical protein GX751_10585 [Desulfuromonadaceae bacterium]|nr:hypothetical protein [Desulfuromonadaceae bacterium]
MGKKNRSGQPVETQELEHSLLLMDDLPGVSVQASLAAVFSFPLPVAVKEIVAASQVPVTVSLPNGNPLLATELSTRCEALLGQR